jgi:hypothetical protein
MEKPNVGVGWSLHGSTLHLDSPLSHSVVKLPSCRQRPLKSTILVRLQDLSRTHQPYTSRLPGRQRAHRPFQPCTRGRAKRTRVCTNPFAEPSATRPR